MTGMCELKVATILHISTKSVRAGLYLEENQIGDNGMIALAGAISSGLLPNLADLFLNKNRIGDAGMSALAGAIASGSLSAALDVECSYNPGSDAPVKRALTAQAQAVFVDFFNLTKSSTKEELFECRSSSSK